MSVVGTFEKTATGFKGKVKTLRLDLPDVQLLKIEGTKRGEKSPDYHVFVEGVALGVAWAGQYKDDKGDKKNFVSAVMDDPDLPHKVNFSLFASQDGKSYQAIWNRPQARR